MRRSGNLSVTLIVSGVLLVVGATFLLVILPMLIKPSMTIWLGNGVFNTKIASTPSDREKGLSGKSELAVDEALLMVFPSETVTGVWMKDMKFPIDVVWLNKDKKVVHIVKNFSINDLTTRYNKKPAQYIMELPAGTVDNMTITINNMAFFQIETKGVQ